MGKSSYSDRQLDAENVLRGIDAPQEAVDEIMNLFADKENLTLNPIQKDESVDAIKLRLLSETDWRKRAALSAMIISKGLE